MEGRDIGTVVFPDADVKIYLDASPEERAKRRASDTAHSSSQTQALADIAQAMQRRDENDRTRQASPLTVAADATTIDTTDLAVEQVVERVMGIARALQNHLIDRYV
jgi:cytidylate kinase